MFPRYLMACPCYSGHDLSFRVTGPLIARLVRVSDKAKKGETLARIDPCDFAVRQRKAEGGLQRSIANRVHAKSNYERLPGIRLKLD